MKHNDFAGINFRKMYTFIVTAEKCNFNNAAMQLNTSISSISKIINSLEQDLEIQLFVRSGKGVELTPAGRYLQKRWVGIIDDIVKSVEKADEIQNSCEYSLRIGMLTMVKYDEAVEEIRKFQEDYADVPVHYLKKDTGDIIKEFNEKNLDIIFLFDKDLINIDGDDVKFKTECEGNLCVYVPYNNPLYNLEGKEISIQQLKKEVFTSIDDFAMPNYNRQLDEIRREYDFRMNIDYYAANVESCFLHMNFSPSIAIAPDFLFIPQEWKIKRFIITELKDVPCQKLIVWREGKENPYIRKYVDYVLNGK